MQTRDEDQVSDAIVDAALDIVVREGLAGLTLRPLAATAGLSVAALSTRMGSKEQLIDRVIDLAARRDRQFGARWLALAARLAPADARARAALAECAFQAWVGARRQAIFLIDLVHDGALHQQPSPALERWLEQAGDFWSYLLFGTPALADLALGYILDEAGFALGAGDDAAYALLRALCLQRFAEGLFARDATSSATIERLIDALAPSDLPVAATGDAKRLRIANAAAQVIVSHGMDATTHRSVALVAKVPASTVVYHFGAREALVVAGLHAVVARFHSTRHRARADDALPGDDSQTRDLVKATAMIALASAREPSLRPYALDMRRRRGENIRTRDLAGLGFAREAGFDRAAGQVVSIALFGMRMVALARQRPERAHYRAAFAAVDRWGADQTGGAVIELA